MSSPNLTYVKQKGNTVEVSYAGLPAGSRVVLVNDTSGATMQNPVTNVTEGGKGKLDIETAVPGGKYHFAAQDSVQNTLAQTVAFYLT